MSCSVLRQLWGDSGTIAVRISKRRLEWLGHVAKMANDRIPKRLLFGWLPLARLPGGPRKR